jgi:DNA-binding transcriptional LysR family regulator
MGIDAHLRRRGGCGQLDACGLFSAKIVANNVAMAHRFAPERMGIAVLPAYRVEADRHEGRLTALLPTFELPQLNLNIAYASRRNLPAKARAFVDFIVAYFQNERLSVPRASIAPVRHSARMPSGAFGPRQDGPNVPPVRDI